MNVVAGIGWITSKEYGCVIKQLRRAHSGVGSLRAELQEDGVLSYPVKGFGTYDLASKMTCCVSALALYDAGISYSESHKQDVGILGTNRDACLQSNLDFFRDFVANGRTLGRAKLFVYTLPSSPVAAAAMHFKLRGPLLYMGFADEQVASLLRQSDRMILRGESPAMLAVSASEEDAQCFVLRREEQAQGASGLGIEQVVDIARRTASIEDSIAPLADAWRKGSACRLPPADTRGKGRP